MNQNQRIPQNNAIILEWVLIKCVFLKITCIFPNTQTLIFTFLTCICLHYKRTQEPVTLNGLPDKKMRINEDIDFN